MSRENPDQIFKAKDFENHVGDILRAHFPFGLLSGVPVYNSESREEDLFANEIDHLVHFRAGGVDYLIIVECKNQEITRTDEQGSDPPSGNDSWFVHYSRRVEGKVVWNSRNVRDQLRRQTKALSQLLGVCPGEKLVIECWLVHRREDCGALSFRQSRGPQFRAFNTSQLEEMLPVRLDDAEIMAVNRSIFLSTIQRSIPKPGAPHPPILDALDYICSARNSIDGKLFKRFNNWFHNKKKLWAIKGTAGSGKSMLLAYALASLATNHRISYLSREKRVGLSGCSSYFPEGVAEFERRKIVACAMSGFQLAALEKHYHMFLDVIASYADTLSPGVLDVEFKRWDGVIPGHCNLLVIDEAHDLTETDQDVICEWHKQAADHYLIIGLDRQQHTRIHRSGKRPFIKGLNFSNSHNLLSKTYRSPISAFMASKALLFRWYSENGPMIKPELVEPEIARSDKLMTFEGGIGVKVQEFGDSNDCNLWIRNDSHPANYWKKSIDLFDSGNELHQILTLERVKKDQVLWLRFDGTPTDIEDRRLADTHAFHRVNPVNPEEFIDSNVKGLEFPIVIIEGIPEHLDNLTEPEKMWQARRLFYICATRATGFLYFVLPKQPQYENIRAELGRILQQFSKSHRSGYAPGETWCMELTWRPDDLVSLEDYAEQ